MFMGVKVEFVVTGPESARSVTKGLEAVKQSGERGLAATLAPLRLLVFPANASLYSAA